MKRDSGEWVQLCFDFDGVQERINALQEIGTPRTDSDILWNLQRKYLQTRSERAFAELWQRFTLLCVKAVKKRLKQKHVFLDEDELLFRADIACEYVLRRYKKKRMKGDVYIIRNFLAAAYWGAKHSCDSRSCNDYILQQSIDLEKGFPPWTLSGA